MANPPAFPNYANDYGPIQEGMSLRDWFAGQALAGFLSNGSQRLINEACKKEPAFLDKGPNARAAVVNELIASGCYELADAMLAESSKP